MISPVPAHSRAASARLDPAVLRAAVQFALVMTANFVLRSVRDEMGVVGGVSNLPWMFSATLGGTLAMVPLYGYAASRLGRRALAAAVYGVLSTSLVALHVAFVAFDGAEATLGWITFVWLSVINMIAVASFWSAVVDVFTGAAARRSFGTIAAGGTVGALVGPALALALADLLGARGLLLVGAALWLAALAAGVWLERALTDRLDVASARAPVSGGMLAGVHALFTNPALRGLAIHVLAFTATSTVLYLVQARVVREAIDDPDTRTALFAALDLAVNVLALALQLVFTARLLARVRLAAALAVLPVITAVLFAGLALAPVLAVLVVAQVLRRASEHAFGKPARELLYEHAPRVTKFHGQNTVDTAVYRAGDAACAWLVEALVGLGVGPSALLLGFAGFSLAWARFAHALGRRTAPAPPLHPEAQREAAPAGR